MGGECRFLANIMQILSPEIISDREILSGTESMKREKLLMTDIKTQNCSQSTRVDLLNMPCFRAHASAYYLCVYHLKAISPSLCELVLYYSKSN